MLNSLEDNIKHASYIFYSLQGELRNYVLASN